VRGSAGGRRLGRGDGVAHGWDAGGQGRARSPASDTKDVGEGAEWPAAAWPSTRKKEA
jgi:hypothetical protein